MTKLVITVEYSFYELKEKYKQYMGKFAEEKITKEDITLWISGLVDADIADLDNE